MSDIDDFDPALFGSWPGAPVYDDRSIEAKQVAAGWSGARLEREVARIILEIKSAEAPPDELRLLLNDVTREIRDQFDYFRKLRTAAEALASGDADDAAAKLARADIKAATDAISLIIRTLEKIDALQRQLARDRDLEAERHEDSEGYDEAKARFLDHIEKTVNERADRLYRQWQQDGHPDDAATGPPATAGPPTIDAGTVGCLADATGSGPAGSVDEYVVDSAGNAAAGPP